jgi:hypothetical protein
MELLRLSAEVDELLDSEEAAPSMLFVDPPDHTRLRALVNKASTPAAVERLRPRVEAIVAGLLDRVAGAGSTRPQRWCPLRRPRHDKTMGRPATSSSASPPTLR